MKQSVFMQQHETLWHSLEQWLDLQELNRAMRKKREEELAAQGLSLSSFDFPATYRQVCHHLALAQSRMYSPLLIERLNRLVIRGHHRLYSSRMHFWHATAEFFLRGLPQLVRRESRAMALSALLFFGSFIAIFIAIQLQPDLAYAVIDGEDLVGIEQMYDPSLQERFGREDEADSDIYMFGYYIRHNIGIDFRSFAGGLLYGLGTLFFLLFNGLFLGTVAGHLTQLGYIETFWGFVSGHSAFELTALVIAGAAGFKLAEALLLPGRKSIRLALRDNSKIAIQLMYGAALLTFMAAFIEAFWSSQAIIPTTLKYGVGIILWLLTLAYFSLVGRQTGESNA